MDYSGPPLGFDVGTHPVEFRDVHIAVFKDRFGQNRTALGQAQHRHQLRLHVSGKAGVGRGGQRDGFQLPIGSNLDPAGLGLNMDPGIAQRLQGGVHFLGDCMFQEHFAASDRRGAGIAAGFDPVAHHAVGRAM